jgi:microcin C transport system substrate-binding protein
MSTATLRLCILSFFIVFPQLSAAQDAEGWRHGGALFGELKYGPDFAHFDYVRPDAPKGGTLHEDALGSFDSFNPFVVRGEPAAGISYTGGLLWDTLFEQAPDQSSAAYGLIAEAFRFPDDFSSATYRLNAKARFHDGQPITPEDVIWSLEVLKQNHPHYSQYYHNVAKAEKTGDREITFTFDTKGNRELPFIIGDLPVLPKHWWTGTDGNGKQRNIAEPTNELPLGSGPYRIATFDSGKSVNWERVNDYWASDLPTRKGRFNFDAIHYTYFLDENAVWEAFKKGGIADTRAENRSQRWATEYNFPAIERGDVVRKAFPTNGPKPFQAYFMNTRNLKFKDERVRKALNLLFDFEGMNKTLFYGLYTRTDSYFEGGELQSGAGKPQGRTREILEGYRGKIPDAAIDGDLAMPVHENAGETRRLQREALKLFTDAGYSFKGGKMLDPDGRQFEIEILGSGPTDERVGIPTSENLSKLGIKATIRLVDQAQYRNRLDKFDFEMTMSSISQSLSPGNEQRDFWTTRAAALAGSRNLAGIADPVVDELVERLIKASDREELIALTRALDRVLLSGSYTIPMWHNPDVWFAWWNKLKAPDTQPLYSGLDIYSWWIEPAGSAN